MEVDVIKRICGVLFLSVVLQCAFCSPAAAQSYNGCLGLTTWYFPDPIPAGWFYYGPYPGTYAYLIASWSYKCPPADGGKEPCPHCPSAGRPISLSTGTTVIEQADLKFPGLGNGLSLVRTWISIWPSTQSASQIGLFGPNWRSNYEERIFVGSDGYTKYARGDGSFWSFGFDTFSTPLRVASPANVSATLSKGASFWTLTFQNGEQREFDVTTGNLIAILDRNGNTTQLTYDTSNRLVTVTDPAGRHLTFTYATGTSTLVTGVSADVGPSLSYAYDGQGRLTQVTNPDLTTISFVYSVQSLITSVLDSSGKVLESHTYDSLGRGLTSARAGGVESLTIAYPQ